MSDDFVEDIMNYLDFLNFKKSSPDWFEQLSDSEIQMIKQGEEDFSHNRIYSNKEALELIQNHIKGKQ